MHNANANKAADENQTFRAPPASINPATAAISNPSIQTIWSGTTARCPAQTCNTTIGATRPRGEAFAIDQADPIAMTITARAPRARLISVLMKGRLQLETWDEIDSNQFITFPSHAIDRIPIFPISVSLCCMLWKSMYCAVDAYAIAWRVKLGLLQPDVGLQRIGRKSRGNENAGKVLTRVKQPALHGRPWNADPFADLRDGAVVVIEKMDYLAMNRR